MKGKSLFACAALCALIAPAGALAVTEGVVESAPQMDIDWEEGNQSLFGVWDEGLMDIENSARKALSQYLGCPETMRFQELSVTKGGEGLAKALQSNLPGEMFAPEIVVRFQYDNEEGRDCRAYAYYQRRTGRLRGLYFCKLFIDGAANGVIERTISDEQAGEAARAYLTKTLGLKAFECGKIREGEVWLTQSVQTEHGEMLLFVDKRAPDVIGAWLYGEPDEEEDMNGGMKP